MTRVASLQKNIEAYGLSEFDLLREPLRSGPEKIGHGPGWGPDLLVDLPSHDLQPCSVLFPGSMKTTSCTDYIKG